MKPETAPKSTELFVNACRAANLPVKGKENQGRADVAWLSIFLILMASCATSRDEQDQFNSFAFRLPDGITVTNERGAIQENDNDDWRIGPLFSGALSVNPMFPNPSSGRRFVLEITKNTVNDVGALSVIQVNEKVNRRLIQTIVFSGNSFFEIVEINPAKLSTTSILNDALGLHRIVVIDFRGNVVTYGDLLFEL